MPTAKISELTISKPLSGSEQFEINQTQNGTLNSYSVSAGAIRTFVESTSVVTAFKNKLINGNFDIWQRSVSASGSGYTSDDRWNNNHSGSSTKTHSQQTFTLGQTDVSGNPKYFSRTVVVTGSTSSDIVEKIQKIESVLTLSGKTATLSFYAKADSSKNIAVEFTQSFGTGGSPSAGITAIGVTTCALTSSWQKFTITVDIPSISGKTLGTNDDDFLAVHFWFDAGSDNDSRTNSLGNQSGTFDIAQVQLEEGSIGTQFERRLIGMELHLCQRYFWKSDIGSYSYRTYASGYTGGDVAVTISYPTTMRAIPTATYSIEVNDSPDTATNELVKKSCTTLTKNGGGTLNFLDVVAFEVDAEL